MRPFESQDQCIGNALRKLRELRKLTQCDGATLHGISNTYLSLIENGKRPIPLPLLFRMLDHYQVEPRAFVASLEDSLTPRDDH